MKPDLILMPHTEKKYKGKKNINAPQVLFRKVITSN